MRTFVSCVAFISATFLASPALAAEVVEQGHELQKTVIAQVHPGMTKTAVRDLLGEPPSGLASPVWSYLYSRFEMNTGLFATSSSNRLQVVTVIYSTDDRVQTCTLSETSSATGPKLGYGGLNPVTSYLPPPQKPCDQALLTTDGGKQ